jgi:hypothetical protein
VCAVFLQLPGGGVGDDDDDNDDDDGNDNDGEKSSNLLTVLHGTVRITLHSN